MAVRSWIAGLLLMSATLALGSGARERYEASSKFPGVKAVSGIGDLASWEPARGTLSVLAGARAVDVRISPSHGSAAERRELSRQIAALALGQ